MTTGIHILRGNQYEIGKIGMRDHNEWVAQDYNGSQEFRVELVLHLHKHDPPNVFPLVSCWFFTSPCDAPNLRELTPTERFETGKGYGWQRQFKPRWRPHAAWPRKVSSTMVCRAASLDTAVPASQSPLGAPPRAGQGPATTVPWNHPQAEDDIRRERLWRGTASRSTSMWRPTVSAAAKLSGRHTPRLEKPPRAPAVARERHQRGQSHRGVPPFS